MKKLFVLWVMWVMVSIGQGNVYGGEIYKGLNPEIFGGGNRGTLIIPSGTRIVAPGGRWAWFNSWHIIRFQPGVFGTSYASGPYTLTNSCDIKNGSTFKTFTWAHFSYYFCQKDLPEQYSHLVNTAKKILWKEWRQNVYIIRIDKIKPHFYVIMYVRIDRAKAFALKEVEKYPPFKINKNLGIYCDHIETNSAYITIFSPHFLPLLINPEICRRAPQARLRIPYSFFKKNFIYEHPVVRDYWNDYGDPLVIIATYKAIILYF